MKTESINISSTGTGKEKALEITEKTGAYIGLDHNNLLRLRLLSEELMGLMNSFTKELVGAFWLEAEDKTIEVHLKTEIPMDLQTRKDILSVATSGKNSAAKSFMGKIREMIEIAILPDDPETKAMTEQAMGLMYSGCQMGTHASNYSWAMSTYVASIESQSQTKAEAKDELADLERSIVANLADDITVHIVGSEVEITIYKTF